MHAEKFSSFHWCIDCTAAGKVVSIAISLHEKNAGKNFCDVHCETNVIISVHRL